MPSSITNHSTIWMPRGSILPDIPCQVPVYYLNADFDYWNMLDWNRPDIDCLHTVYLMTMAMTMWMTIMMSMTLVMMQVGPALPMPEQMTICLRTLHYTFLFPKFSYAFAFFFGSLLSVRLSVCLLVCLHDCFFSSFYCFEYLFAN